MGNGRKTKLKRGFGGTEEHDLTSDWRDVVFWQPGERRRIKRRLGKRERRVAKKKTRELLEEAQES